MDGEKFQNDLSAAFSVCTQYEDEIIDVTLKLKHEEARILEEKAKMDAFNSDLMKITAEIENGNLELSNVTDDVTLQSLQVIIF